MVFYMIDMILVGEDQGTRSLVPIGIGEAPVAHFLIARSLWTQKLKPTSFHPTSESRLLHLTALAPDAASGKPSNIEELGRIGSLRGFEPPCSLQPAKMLVLTRFTAQSHLRDHGDRTP